MFTSTVKKLWISLISVAASICLACGLLCTVNASAGVFTGLSEEVALNKVVTTNGVTADGFEVEYLEFEMGESGNTWFMTQFTGKNAPNYAVRAVQGYSSWDGAYTKWNSQYQATITELGLLICNSTEYGGFHIPVYRGSTQVLTAWERGLLQSQDENGTNVLGMRYYDPAKTYVQIIGYEVATDGSTNATFTVYLYEVTDSGLSLMAHDTDTKGSNTNALAGTKAVIYGNMQASKESAAADDFGLSGQNNPDCVVFQYAKPANSLQGLMQNVSDHYEYKDDLKTALGLTDVDTDYVFDVPEIPEVVVPQATTLSSSATLAQIKATTGVASDVEYIEFDADYEKDVWFITQFTGQNAPNFAVRATQGFSTWDSNTTAAATINGTNTWHAGMLLTQTSEESWQGLFCYRGTITDSTTRRGNIAAADGLGLNKQAVGTEYIQVIGYSPQNDDTTATLTAYVFKVANGQATLLSSGTANPTYAANALAGRKAVIYGNIGVTSTFQGPSSVSFQYETPASDLSTLINNLQSDYAYKDDLATALNVELRQPEEEVVESTVLPSSATLNKIVTDGYGAASNVQSVAFDGLGGATWFMVQFTGNNAPNFAVRSTAQFTEWGTATTGNDAGMLICTSCFENQRDIRLFRGTNTSNANGGSRRDLSNYTIGSWNNGPGNEYFNASTEYVMIVGYAQNATTSTSADITVYIYKISNGTLVQTYSTVATATYAYNALTGNKAVIYGNIGVTASQAGPDSITFSYVEPADSLAGLLKNVKDNYAYKDDLVSALSLGESDTTYQTVKLEASATLAQIQATGGAATGVEYIEFDADYENDVWFMTQFTGRNAPNFAVRAVQGFSTWDSNTTTEADIDGVKTWHAGMLLAQSTEYNSWNGLFCFRGTNTNRDQNWYRGALQANSGKGLGFYNQTAGKEYIQIVGYSPVGNNNSAILTAYVFEVENGNVSLVYSGAVEATSATNVLAGRKAVIYGNINLSATTDDDTNTSVSFSYQTPANSLSELLAGLDDGYVYKTALTDIIAEETKPVMTLTDMDGNVILTAKNAYELPASDLANFVGWYCKEDGKLYKAGEAFRIESNMTFVEVALDTFMAEGASVRVSYTDTQYGGLRFEAIVNKNAFDILGDKAVWTGAVVPTDLLNGEFTLSSESIKTASLDNKALGEDGNYHAYITLTNVKYANYYRKYSARAFITLTYADGSTATYATGYHEENNSRSIYEVAVEAYKAGDNSSNSVLLSYIDSTVVLSLRADDSNMLNISTTHTLDGLPISYARKYSATVNGNTLSINIPLADRLASLGNVPVYVYYGTEKLTKYTATYSDGVGTVEGFTYNNVPIYDQTDGSFDYWAYSGTCDNWYKSTNAEGEEITVWVDTLQSEANTQKYFDAGFNVLFIDWTIPYAGMSEAYFERSQIKEIMDYAAGKGKKCFLYVTKLHSLSSSETSLIVTDGTADGVNTFASQEELNEYVAKMLSGVASHPAFYGISLVDEPYYYQFDAIGEVYKALQEVAPGSFCNINLNPMSKDYRALERYNKTMNEKFAQYDTTTEAGDDAAKIAATLVTNTQMQAAYEEYLELYYEKVGQYCNYIQYDSYPFSASSLLENYFLNMQIVSDFATQKGMQFGHVYQSYNSGRALTQNDMYWQTNLGMAMGVKTHAYYTYYPRPDSATTDTESTFVDREGNENDMYNWMQGIHEEMALTAKALSNFTYQGLNYYVGTAVSGANTASINKLTNGYAFKKLSSVSNTMGHALVTELYDDEINRYGYFVMNATDPSVSSSTKVTLKFEGFSHVMVYKNGMPSEIELTNGEYTFTLYTAKGAFIVPFNA